MELSPGVTYLRPGIVSQLPPQSAENFFLILTFLNFRYACCDCLDHTSMMRTANSSLCCDKTYSLDRSFFRCRIVLDKNRDYNNVWIMISPSSSSTSSSWSSSSSTSLYNDRYVASKSTQQVALFHSRLKTHLFHKSFPP